MYSIFQIFLKTQSFIYSTFISVGRRIETEMNPSSESLSLLIEKFYRHNIYIITGVCVYVDHGTISDGTLFFFILSAIFRQQKRENLSTKRSSVYCNGYAFDQNCCRPSAIKYSKTTTSFFLPRHLIRLRLSKTYCLDVVVCCLFRVGKMGSNEEKEKKRKEKKTQMPRMI